ncbi:transcription termination/antitermination factor NusG, partial [Candidatus Dojkabacteria bacterium]|nr:transcription termination/antitermination factor NusG [Candidatus Dojkabacteria bacterium]
MTDTTTTEIEKDYATDINPSKGLNWFIVNTYSGHEKKVAQTIEQLAKANGLEDEIVEVLVPTQEKVVAQGGKKKTVEDKMFPGYVLINMLLNDQTWHLIRNTEGVTGFLGTGKKPTPLSPEEVGAIKAFSEVEQPSYQAAFRVGESVKVVSGNWKDFIGKISAIDERKGQVTVLLSIFGRETPVPLDFLEVTTDL